MITRKNGRTSFGKSIANRIGNAGARRLIYTHPGGNMPQWSVNRLFEMVTRGEVGAAMICGGEALATQKAAERAKLALDWNEDAGGTYEEWGVSKRGWSDVEDRHRMAGAIFAYPLFEQGSASRHQLRTGFRESGNGVLLGAASFWEGVHVAGEALSVVVIDKLPFASPGDPVLAARIDAIRAEGGEPFGAYQVPLAILALQQGLGRLIRHRQDRGVLAVLDPRLRTKGYGRRFLASLPPAPLVSDLDAIDAFFQLS